MIDPYVNEQLFENGNVLLILAVVVVQPCNYLRDEFNESLRWNPDVILLEDVDERGAFASH